jgi:hypothetical protein
MLGWTFPVFSTAGFVPTGRIRGNDTRAAVAHDY